MKERSTVAQRRKEASPLRLVSSDQMLDRMKETFDAIARRAFELFESNGRRFGRELEDWFEAEAELLHPVHLEVSETEGALTVRAEVPGFTEKEIQVNVEPRRLTITGKRESTEERKTEKMLYSERCSNQILRVVDLPIDVDAASSALKAAYDRGVLTITLPKTGNAMAREAREVKVESAAARG